MCSPGLVEQVLWGFDRCSEEERHNAHTCSSAVRVRKVTEVSIGHGPGPGSPCGVWIGGVLGLRGIHAVGKNEMAQFISRHC